MGTRTVLGLVALMALAGCVAPGTESPGRYPPPSEAGVCAEPGETVTIQVSLTHTDQVSVYPPTWNGTVETDPIEVAYSNVSADPPIFAALQRYPPIWQWEGQPDVVNLTLPVHVSDGAQPGIYELTLWNLTVEDDHDTSPRHTIPLEVGDCG